MAIERARESLRHLLGGLLEPLLEPSRLAPGWSLDDWETEQGATLGFRGPDGRLGIELEAADASRPCYARTQRFNVYFNVIDRERTRRDLGDSERAVLDAVVRVLREGEPKLPLLPREPDDGHVQVRELVVDRALVNEGPGSYYLNPYVGCVMGCPFCYAAHRADFSRSIEGAPRRAWGRWVDAKVNLPDVLADEVTRLPPGYVRMSPIITDPYQPIERKFRITRRVLEVLQPTAFRPVVLTRAERVVEDLGLLARCTDATLGVSIPTDDDDVRRAFEPGTDPVDGRLRALEAASRAGLRTFVIVQPMLPLDPAKLVDAVAPHARAVRIGPLFEKQRIAEVHARLGRSDCLDEAWERRTFEDLKSRFEARGVLVNPESAEWKFLR